MANRIPHLCPSCNSMLRVTGLQCRECQTQVSGVFALPLLARLTVEEQEFIIDFIKNRGNTKEVVKKMGLSYPTVRNMFDELIGKIKKLEIVIRTESYEN